MALFPAQVIVNSKQGNTPRNLRIHTLRSAEKTRENPLSVLSLTAPADDFSRLLRQRPNSPQGHTIHNDEKHPFSSPVQLLSPSHTHHSHTNTPKKVFHSMSRGRKMSNSAVQVANTSLFSHLIYNHTSSLSTLFLLSRLCPSP